MQRDYLRKHKDVIFSDVLPNEEMEFEETLESNIVEFSPEESVDYSETKRLINEMIQKLSEEQRMCILLFYYEQLSVKEIASAMDCSENTVKTRLAYARKKLETDVKELEKKGTKLYSISIIPFIIWMLRGNEHEIHIPKCLYRDFISTSSKSGFQKASQASETKGVAAKNIAKISAAVKYKVGVGILVAALAGGETIVAFNQNKESSESVSAVMQMEEMTNEEEKIEPTVESNVEETLVDGTEKTFSMKSMSSAELDLFHYVALGFMSDDTVGDSTTIESNDLSDKTLLNMMAKLLVEDNVMSKEIHTDDAQVMKNNFFYATEYVTVEDEELFSYIKETFNVSDRTIDFDNFYDRTEDGLLKVKMMIGDYGILQVELEDSMETVDDLVSVIGSCSGIKNGAITYMEVNGRTIPVTEIIEVSGKIHVQGHVSNTSVLGGYTIERIELLEEETNDTLVAVGIEDVSADLWKKIIRTSLHELEVQSSEIPNFDTANGFEFVDIYYKEKHADYVQEEVFKEIFYDKELLVLTKYLDVDSLESKYAFVVFPNAVVISDGSIMEEETGNVNECTIKIGYSKEMVDDVLEQTSEHYDITDIDI